MKGLGVHVTEHNAAFDSWVTPLQASLDVIAATLAAQRNALEEARPARITLTGPARMTLAGMRLHQIDAALTACGMVRTWLSGIGRSLAEEAATDVMRRAPTPPPAVAAKHAACGQVHMPGNCGLVPREDPSDAEMREALS